jgi:hypothetical protein
VERTSDSVGILNSQIQLFRDDSLPKDWLVKTTRRELRSSPDDDEVLFIDAHETWFSSKVEAAAFLEPKGHPAIELAQLVTMTMERARLLSSPPVSVSLRRGSAEGSVLTTIMSQTSYVEMVKLPDVFLVHPCVRVTETANEMVIEDVDTGEFIAKKIMFDG